MSQKVIRIGQAEVGFGQPAYIIAEAGVNHNGDVRMAIDLVKMAEQTGANCVKFQTFKAERIVTSNSPKAAYQLKVTDVKESQFDMLKKLELTFEDYERILAECNRVGIQFLSTPYSVEDAEFLMSLGVDAFKIASGQISELPFLKYLAGLGKPLILSTGMATMAEVYQAVDGIREAGNDDVIILQCTTNYPSLIGDANLRAMGSMKEALDCVIGYSDHVPENYACYAAVALGASVVEKHFTLRKDLPGPDHSSSLEPNEFRELVNGIRNVEASLGSPIKKPTEAEKNNTYGMRRGMVASKALKAGQVITRADIAFKRPLEGLVPNLQDLIIGHRLKKDLAQDEPIKYEHIDW